MAARIIIADDHALFREMLCDMIPQRGNAYVIAGEAEDGDQTVMLVARHQPDILLLDYKMPGLGRLSDFCKKVTRKSPLTRIILLTGFSDEKIALEAATGAIQGWVLKGAAVADLLAAIATVQAGGIWIDTHLPQYLFRAFLRQSGGRTAKLAKLTRQELKVLSLAAQGKGNQEIGPRLYISQKTVKNHLTHIFAKLGLTNRRQAAEFFFGGKRRKTRMAKRSDFSKKPI